jgi:hypothetical protein
VKEPRSYTGRYLAQAMARRQPAATVKPSAKTKAAKGA